MSLARKLYDLFFEGCTHYSVAKTNKKGALAYYTETGIPSLDLIEQHLRGEVVLGAYTIIPGSNVVRYLAFDIDSKADPAKAREITVKICECLDDLPYFVEWSGNKGYHVYVFFDNPNSAAEVKEVGDRIRDTLGLPKSGDPHVEVYPKQDILTPSNPLGNLLRLPLGEHPTTHNKTMFVDPFNGFEDGPERDPEKVLSFRTTITKLREKLQEKDPRRHILTLLLPYWSSGQRHDMALYTSGYLASLGWTEESVIDLVTELGAIVGEGDVDNQLECVTDTFRKVYKNQNVKGFDGLSHILPASVLKELTEVANEKTFSATLQMIDRIRLGKGQQFQKVRNSAKSIVSYFIENGKLVRDENNVYWLDQESRELLIFNGGNWNLFMHTHFGLNPLDAFGKQVMESVRLYSQAEAELVTVRKRAYWNTRLLYINLGGPEVYVLDGVAKGFRTILNGEDGIIFLNSEDRLRVPNLSDSSIPELSPWPALVDDLSFLSGETTHATPIQQRELLKAYILGIFFAETMPTRPILTFLAAPGAGKTTSARRILRFFEGPYEDVLGVVPDKPDSIRSSLMAHKVLVLDNLEKTKAHWLTDVLNRASTGSHIEVRTLYKTNEVSRMAPDVFVIITATEIPFSEETVFTRMLPLELAPLLHPRPEYAMQIKLLDQFNSLWKGMLTCLNEVVKELKENRIVEAPNESRLADFTVFCSRIKDCSFVDGKQLMDGLANMVSRQKKALKESSPFIPVLENWMKTRPEDAATWHTMAEIFAATQRIANSGRMEWRWSSAQGLSRHFSALETDLIRFFGLHVRTGRQNGTDIKQYKFTKTLVETQAEDDSNAS